MLIPLYGKYNTSIGLYRSLQVIGGQPDFVWNQAISNQGPVCKIGGRDNERDRSFFTTKMDATIAAVNVLILAKYGITNVYISIEYL